MMGVETLQHLALILLGVLFVQGCSCVVVPKTQSAGEQVRIMTFNILHGGTRRGQPLSQTVRAITDARADIVGLQEVSGSLEELAAMLGWHFARLGRSAAIVSRYDIVARYEVGPHGGGVRIRLNSGREIDVFNVHLSPAPYQPYQLLGIPYGNAPFIETEAQAIASAQQARGEQVTALLERIRSVAGAGEAVFVTGDFNEPSHLDWTEAAARSARHPLKVACPTSRAMAEAGFRDAWRTTYPDEMAKPGYTWTPVTEPTDPTDHHDRIDFVYYRGAEVRCGAVDIVGESAANAGIVVSPYPSDHRAVVATFTVRQASSPSDAR